MRRASLTRRSFVHLAGASSLAGAFRPLEASAQSSPRAPRTPRLGMVAKVRAGRTVEEVIKRVHDLGLPSCQLFYEHYSMQDVRPLLDAMKRYDVSVSAISEHNPGRRIFNFYQGPSTIGVIPPETRRARIDALKFAAEFAHACGVAAIHSHLGFIPEDPNDPIYPGAVGAIREVAEHCKKNAVMLLAETGQETPTTLLRMIQDVGTGNVFVNLDTANLILYGKGNPVDAMDVLGHLVRGTHAKDGLFPTGTRELGEEVLIGKGKVDFPVLLQKLKDANYPNVITIERESEGPHQGEEILQAKAYLQRILDKIYA